MKKRSYQVFLMVVLLAVSSMTFSVQVQADASDYWTYYATPVTPEDDVYNIQDASQLAWIAEQVNIGNISLYECTISLINDIDLSGHSWVPIGNESYSFRGTFDGNGYTISNLNIGSEGTPTDSAVYAGLFGYAGDSTFIDVIMTNVEIHLDSSSISPITYVGCLAGYVSYSSTASMITGCNAEGSIEVSGDGPNSYAGGLVGTMGNDCSIEDSSASVNITTSGLYGYIGGLAGSTMFGCSISGCSTDGNITGGNYSYIGGLIGYSSSREISESHAEGNVSGGEGSQVGGLIGFASNIGNVGDTGVYGSYALGEVKGGNYSADGGLIGYNANDISIGNCEICECFAEGNVSGGDLSVNGGLLGYNNASWTHSSYAKGSISGGIGSSNGGFVGYNFLSLTDNCYSAGGVSVDAAGGNVGGFAGDESGDDSCCIIDSYWNSDVNDPGISSIGHTDVDSAEDRAAAKASDEMKEDAFADLLNLSVGGGSGKSWTIIAGVNDGYPVLRENDLCTVTFDKNGGDTEASPNSKLVKQNEEAGALPIPPTWEDHAFTDWNTETDGSGETFTETSIVDSDMTVYAQWIISPELISITAPEDITGVPNGTAKTAAGLGLPENVTIVTDSGDMQSNVEWDVASCSYDPDTLTEQNFYIDGTVILPAGVKNTNGVELMVSINVTVNSAPAITGVSPSGGSMDGGTLVTITGSNLTGATGVTIGGAAATDVNVISDTSITAKTPAGIPGTADVVVITPGGNISGVGLFTYYGPPFITGIEPNYGPIAGGTIVTITGIDLIGVTEVTIGGAAATNVTVNSATSVTATTPAGTAGFRDVTVTSPEGSCTIPDLYIYYAVPTITGINPSSGPTAGGMLIDIFGSNLIGPAGILGVTIGGKACTDVGVIIFPAGVRARVPAGTAGTKDVVVTTPGGSVTRTNGFTYTEAPAVTTQAVSDITPTTATGHGNITTLGVPNPTQHGVVWNKTGNPNVMISNKTSQGPVSAAGAFSSSITGLSPNTTYYVRAYVTSPAGTFYGSQVTFKTLQQQASTPAASVTINNGSIKKDAEIKLSSEAGAVIYYTVALNGDTPAVPNTSTPTYVSNGGTIIYPALTYGDVVKIKAVAAVAGKTESAVTDFSFTVQSRTSLTLTGIKVNDKEYDGNTDAAADFTGVGISGVIGTDAVALAGTPRVSFLTPDVGNGKTVTVSGYSLSGMDADYYTMDTTLTSAASVLKKNVTATDIVIRDKVYDGKTEAVISGIALSWKAAGDDVYIKLSAAAAFFSDAGAGNSKQVTVIGLELAGADSGNYQLTTNTAAAVGNIVYSAMERENEPKSQPSSSPQVEKSVPASISITVNGKIQDIGTVSTTTAQGQAVTTVTINDKKLTEIIESGGNNASVTISVSKNSDAVAGVLNGQTIKNMETKEAVLEIRTDNASYIIPASQIDIDAMAAKLGASSALEDIKVRISIAGPSADTVKIIEDTASRNNYNIIVKPIEFEITCTNGDKTINVSRFSGYVERMVAIPEGVDPSKITTAIVLNKDGSFSHIPTSITVINGKYYAKISSLTNSTYSVIRNSRTFTDIEKHWAKEAIEDLASRLIAEGIDKENFAPYKEITRGDFSSIIVKGLGLMRSGTGKDVYDDVKKTDWYYDAVFAASEYGLVNGTGNGRFEPDKKITREEAMVIMARAMAIAGMDVEIDEAEAEKQLEKYKDNVKIKSFAKKSAAVCIKNGIIKGIGDEIKPGDDITRAEVAEIVRRLLQKAGLIL